MLPVIVVAGLPLSTHDVFTALGIAVAFLVFLAEARRRRDCPCSSR